MRYTLKGTASVAACTLAVTAFTMQPAAGTPSQAPPHDLGRQVLASNDGWAAAEGGTTGGSAATDDHVYYVHNRSELVAALGGEKNDTPKIIHVVGTIDGNVDDANRPLSCDDYAQGTGYTLDKYLAAYGPDEQGTYPEVEGELEDARAAAEDNQGDRVQIPVPSNTTIVGQGDDATLEGVNLVLNAHDVPGAADNIIIRNLTFRNAFDCFPQWDPGDGSSGNWNSEFDNITVIHSATHIWVDHNTFTDAPYFDDQEPKYFGREYQKHDGATDITDAADFVTVSWNTYQQHDKLMLIGSTNSDKYNDGDHLRVTVHHNLFKDVGQRAPRLRWGQNDVYNNYYVETGERHYDYQYSWGVGYQSHIYAENNYFALPEDIDPGEVIHNWGGENITTVGNVVNRKPVDLLAAFNATHDDTLTGDDSWAPHLRGKVDNAQAVPGIVGAGAGAGRL